MREDYEHAKRLGDRAVRHALSHGTYPYLPALADSLGAQMDTLSREKIGLCEIPVSMVAGTATVGRQNAFAANFMPILSPRSEFASKWWHLYDSHMSEGIRDAIRVYEYMRRFYVVEGNKRVSIMRYVGVETALAEVTRILPAKSDDPEYVLYEEFLAFYRVCPLYEIDFSKNGGYRVLAELLGQDLTHPWPEELIEDLRAAHTYFAKAFNARRIRQEMTAADALAVYLNVYSLESIIDDGEDTLKKRIDRLQGEMLTAVNDRNVNLVEHKAQIEEAEGGLIGSLTHPLAPSFTSRKPLKAAFLYDRSPEDSAWNYAHELGRLNLEGAFNGAVETLRFDGCEQEGALSAAVLEAVSQGAEMVFSTSPAQMQQILREAIAHPQVAFLNCSVNLPRNAVRTYYIRSFEAKFLMGALAASLNEGHLIGYCADYPIYGQIANINAFAVGAAMIDPKARIFLRWSTEAGADWREEMKAAGVKMLSGPDFIRPDDASREYGLFRFTEEGQMHRLAAPVSNWGRYYRLIIKSYLDGNWNAKSLAKKDQALSYWLGMAEGVSEIIYSGHLAYQSGKLLSLLTRGLKSGVILPFAGELRSREGVVVKAGEAPLSARDIITMDWLCDNVDGRIPALTELTPSAQQTVRISGVGHAREGGLL